MASAAFTASVVLRKPFHFDVIKDRGALARVVDEGVVENVYRLQVMNRSEAPRRFRVSVEGPSGLTLSAPELLVPPTEIGSVVVAVRLPPAQAEALQGQSVPVFFDLALQAEAGQAAVVQREKSTFYVPR